MIQQSATISNTAHALWRSRRSPAARSLTVCSSWFSFIGTAIASQIACSSTLIFWLGILVLTWCHWPIHAADILLPMVEPRLPIAIQAENGSKSQRGAYEVFDFTGDCSIEQGSFIARGKHLQVWIDRFAMSSSQASSDRTDLLDLDRPKPNEDVRWMYKLLVRVDGQVQVELNLDEKLLDDSWTGRLYSHRYPAFNVKAWSKSEGLSTSSSTPPATQSSQPTNSNDFLLSAFQSIKEGNEVRLAQFEQLPNQSSPPLPPTEGVLPMELPNTANGFGRQGSLIEPAQNPLGGIDLDAGMNSTMNIEEIMALQPTAPIPTQVVPSGSPGLPQGPAAPPPAPRIGAQNFEFSGRGSVAPELRTIARPEVGDYIVAISRGLRMKFGGANIVTRSGPMELGTVVLEADRALIWTTSFEQLMSGKVEGLPIEVYLEGNVVFQQGPRTIYADRMYYNAQAESGMVLGAEILTPAPQFEGLVRLKADVIEQRSRQSFLAYNAAMTSSRLGVPRYWLQADRLSLEDARNQIDAATAEQLQRTGTTNIEATARNNFVYLGGLPVLYWPVMTSNIDSPNFYLRSVKVKNDSIFGQQLFLDWDLHQLLGLDGPDGTDWRLSTDYLSKRGFAAGTTYRYNVPHTFLPGPATGYFDAWGLNDRGQDFLGRDRENLEPERDTRGRITFRHRQYLNPDLELWAELGLISDRNFQEQFFEREWDEEKDASTNLRLRRHNGNRMLDIVGSPRVNRFFTETEWLPRIDHYWLGQSIFDRLTWYAHSQVGYAHQRVASTPTNAADQATFALQPWEVDAEGIRAGTRQELALPLDFGPIKLVPYVNGEIMTWGEDVTGDSLTRLTGQSGIRSTLPFWKVYPEIQSRLFNVNGIAHKAAWDTEFFYADTNRNIQQLPLYDPLDDNSQEHFRRRLVFNTFSGTLPDKFDPRTYAIRQGLQRYVTASSSEVVEDQMQFRIGLDQRWQTKRGLAGRERITDLFEFDVDAILFPKSDRDNFGQTVGAINYDFRFHAGDRLTLLSDGYFDVFDRGLKVLSGGFLITRPGRLDYYIGLTSLRGPIHTLVANSNINYRLNEKWIVQGGSTFDLGEVGNVGQSASIIRIGESFLTQIGLNIDSGRDNASVFFNLEPRFFPFRGIGSVGGQPIPQAGFHGLE